MTIFSYSRQAVTLKLETLSPALQSLFAAAAAQRLIPAYERFHQKTGKGDPLVLKRALEHLWSSIFGASEDLEGDLRELEGLRPAESDWSVETGLAENAVSSAEYAIESHLNRDFQYAAWAAEQVYEAVDLWVRNRDNVDFNIPGSEQQVLRDPVVQAQLSFLIRDLEELRAASDQFLHVLGDRIRRRSEIEGRSTFGES
jgi:hypothetical protein